MKAKGIILSLMLISFGNTYALCDITEFRWECDIPPNEKPTPAVHSLVICGDTPLYVTKSQYELIASYQRANINMVLTVNGEYITSPCIAAGRYGAEYF